MTELERAVDALKAAVKQGGIDKRVSDVVNQFTSYLVLLVGNHTLFQKQILIFISEIVFALLTINIETSFHPSSTAGSVVYRLSRTCTPAFLRRTSQSHR
jgi:hypothetical protein